MKGLTTYLPNAEGRASPASTIATASAAPCFLLSPASHIAKSAGNKIKVIICPLPSPPMVPCAIERTKKKRKKATALAAPVAASDNALSLMPTQYTAPATKKGKMTSKKKAAKPVNLCVKPMRAKTTKGASHHIVAITHRQKWVVGNNATINGDIANEPSSGCQWYQKEPSGERILPGNLDFTDMLWGRTWPRTTRAEGNKVGEGQPTKNNNQPLIGAVL